jgi:hypothetical protein
MYGSTLPSSTFSVLSLPKVNGTFPEDYNPVNVMVAFIIANARRGPNLRGVAMGALLTSLIPMLSGAVAGVDIGAYASELVGGGVSGAIDSLITNRTKGA